MICNFTETIFHGMVQKMLFKIINSLFFTKNFQIQRRTDKLISLTRFYFLI